MGEAPDPSQSWLVKFLDDKFRGFEKILDTKVSNDRFEAEKLRVDGLFEAHREKFTTELSKVDEASIRRDTELNNKIVVDTSAITKEDEQKAKRRHDLIIAAWTVGSVLLIAACTLIAPSVHIHFP